MVNHTIHFEKQRVSTELCYLWVIIIIIDGRSYCMIGACYERCVGSQWSDRIGRTSQKPHRTGSFLVITHFNNSFTDLTYNIQMKLNSSAPSLAADLSRIVILGSDVVGNVEDRPSHAVHRRKHKWWGKRGGEVTYWSGIRRLVALNSQRVHEQDVNSSKRMSCLSCTPLWIQQQFRQGYTRVPIRSFE
jgi:hypothetical protein